MSNQTEQDVSPLYDERPWGSYTVLDDGDYFKVKRIEVLPGKRLSYQRHSRRAEHWFVVRGTAKVTLNGKEILVRAGEAGRYLCRIGTPRRESDPLGNLIFIEIQTGDYFGEDDIIRLDDDFGRV
ncbi:MAG: phosphomannose isomerase type II C-terminal cupin domain [Acidobacteria bacterium]|nr:phosphomannose isomerase type II C-terminal cupin domain [Acidobacteriota bacterium]